MKYAIDETELTRLVAKACRRPKPTTFDKLRNAVPALVAEVRRLREEVKQGSADYCALMDRHDAQFVRAEQAEAENVRLTKIVGNFASIEAGRCVDSRTRNGMPLNDMCTVTGQIQAARQAVADSEVE